MEVDMEEATAATEVAEDTVEVDMAVDTGVVAGTWTA
jgi:hypothetical protein